MRTSAWAASALAYTVLTAILGRDVLSQLGTAIANDPGDPLLTAAILHWNAGHVPFTDAWWQFPIYHPTRDALAFSEHLLGIGVISTPLAWITGNPLAAYNLTLLVTFPLCGMAMFALVYALTRSAAGAFVAGLAYAFGPYRMSSLPHIQMLTSLWAPLALLGLHKFIAFPASGIRPDGRASLGGAVPSPGLRAGTSPSVPGDGRISPEQGRDSGEASGTRARPAGRLRWLALFGVCWALQAASNWYMLVLFTVFVGLWELWFVIVARRWRAALAMASAVAVAALPLVPIVYRYLTVHALHGFERSITEVRVFSADLSAVLCATPALTFWGWVGVFCRAEGELFPGAAVFGLFAAALVLTLRRGAGSRERSSAVARRAFRVVQTLLIAVCVVYALVVLSIVTRGPWEIAPLGISATTIDKPLLVAVAASALALLMALARHAWHPSASPVSFYLFGAIVMWLFALGPTISLLGESTGRPGPFALLQWLPGMSGLRVPARFWLLAVLCLAVVVGYVVAWIVSGRRRVPALVLVGLLSAAVLADGWMPPIRARQPPATVADAGALRGGVVMELPVEPGADIAAMWRAVTGGWTSVNGYSGYTPNYYTALNLAARAGDSAMFAPFRRNDDLHVLVPDESGRREVVERQPGAVLLARGNGFAHYKLPRHAGEQAGQTYATGRASSPLPLAALRSACASETVTLAHDGNEKTRWECLEGSEEHGLVADLGAPQQVGAVVYSIGPFGWNVPTALAIDVSLDGAVWETASEGSILGPLIEGGIADPSALRATVAFPPRAARYVRVRPVNQSAGFGWFVSELDIHAP